MAHVGVPIQERRRRQRVVLDLDLGLSLRAAGRSDRVESTVDYAQVVREAKGLVESGSFRLVEAMAEAVATQVLSRFRADRIRVRVRKFSVPGTDSVGVELVRFRKSGR